MARTALYDLEQVLTEAVDIFLEHSYHGAIMEEIIARTGFNRRGFYLEFGSKQEFLYQVLKHYQANQLEPILVELQSHAGMAAIQLFFHRYIDLIQLRGCLLINCVTELGHDDEIIKSMGRHYLDQLQLGFIGNLEKAMTDDVIRNDINIESTALQLTSYVQGFAVNAILAQSSDEMRIATDTLLTPMLKNAP